MNILRKLRALVRRESLDAEMSEEMRAHLELETKARIAGGCSPAEARYAAQRSFGGVEQMKERCRDERLRGLVWLEQFGQDLRHAAASLRRTRGFSFTVIFTLALGLGATAAIFTIVDTVLWRPLPYAEPHRLVASQRFTMETLQVWTPLQRIFDRIETHLPRSMVLTDGEGALHIGVDAVAPGMFDLLGRAPAIGRPITPGDAERGNHQVVVLSHGFWQRHFGGDPAVVGRVLTLDDQRHAVIGVMPRGFAFPRPNTELWIPLVRAVTEAEQRQRVEIVGRLRTGMDATGAKGAATALNQQLNRSHPLPREWNVELYPLDGLRANPAPRRMMKLFLGAVACVLLVACTNVANLLLVRASARQREFAVRSALGAGGGRLVRQVLTESLLLVLCGALGGVLVAHWAVKALWMLAPNELTFLVLNEVRVDWRVMGVTIALVGVATLICGLVPALRAARSDHNPALGAGARTATAGRGQQRWQHGFVVAQCALAFVLLVGAGLLTRGFLRLNAVDPGFETKNLLGLSVSLPGQRYPSAAQRQDFYARLAQQVAALPGVAGTALAAAIPPRAGGFSTLTAVEIEGRPAEKLSAGELLPYNIIDDDYLRVMGIPLLRGRGFGAQDVKGAPPTIIINDRLARRFWPDGDPLGQRVRFDPQQPWLTVVGVTGDVKAMSLSDEHGAFEYYRSIRQDGMGGYGTLVIRSSTDAVPLMPAIRRVVGALDSRLPIGSLATADDLMSATLAIPRFCLVLMGVFAGTAIILAAIGIYGVMAYTVAQRTPEIGLRIALGGDARAIMRLVAGRGLALTAGGVVVGIAAGVGLTRFLESLLFEVSALDPITFVVVAGVLSLCGALASWLPARRAALINPMVALRNE